jgi:hypothetical protein
LWGGGERKIMVQGQPGKILVQPCLKKKLDMLSCACGHSYLGGRGRIGFQANLGKVSGRPHLKNKLKENGMGK